MKAEAPVFDNRPHAGKELAKHMTKYRGKRDVIVLAISKEGVEVAFSLAQELRAPMDVVISNLLPIPQKPGTHFGAVTQDIIIILNEGPVAQFRIKMKVVLDLAQDAQNDARNKMLVYRGDRPEPDLANKTVIIADDGMGIGLSIVSAVVWAQQADAKQIIVAVPVGTVCEIQLLRQLVNEVVCLVTPNARSLRIATFYQRWVEPTDLEIKSLIEAASTYGLGSRRKE